MKRNSILATALIVVIALLSSCQKRAITIPDDEVMEIAAKAYVYGYPLVLMEYTKRVGINVEQPNDFGFAPINQVGHFRQFPDHAFTGVVKPNVDTYYSIAWFDLKKEPMVLSVPATDRYYLLPLLDAFTNVFSVPGTRTTGTEAHTFLLAGPFWNGEVPEGMTLIQSPTDMVWMIGRTQVNSPEDGATVVKKFQDGLTIAPLSQQGRDYTPPKGTVSEEAKQIVPVRDVKALPVDDFFNLVAQLLVDNPPADADSAIVGEMESIGLVSGEEFSMDVFSPELQEKLNTIPEAVHSKFQAAASGKGATNLRNGWMITIQGMGTYGIDYDHRALIAYFGLGANLPEDAVYPSAAADGNGDQLMGEKKYVLHFKKNEFPPVNAFWSLTAYDKRDFLVDNPIRRYAIGDRSDLKYNRDGSLDIYIQNTSPGKAKEANWLPSPKEGPMNLTLRLYWPKASVLDGSWVPPAVKKVR